MNTERIRENIRPFKRHVYNGVIRPLIQGGIDRKDRFISVCCSCERWWTGNGWQVSNMPVGKYTYTYCELCLDEAYKQARIDLAEMKDVNAT